MMALSEINNKNRIEITRTALKSWYMKLTTILQFSYTKWIAIKSTSAFPFNRLDLATAFDFILFICFFFTSFYSSKYIWVSVEARVMWASVRAHFTGIYFWFCIFQRSVRSVFWLCIKNEFYIRKVPQCVMHCDIRSDVFWMIFKSYSELRRCQLICDTVLVVLIFCSPCGWNEATAIFKSKIINKCIRHFFVFVVITVNNKTDSFNVNKQASKPDSEHALVH